MRVLTVSEPGLDGVFRHVEALVHYLVARGVEVDLAWSSVRPSGELHDLVAFVERNGGRTVDLKVGPRPGPGDALALARLWLLANRRQPDVVHGHSSKAGALVRLLAPLLAGPRFFYTPHAYFGLDGGARDLKMRVFHAIESWLGSTCPTIHVSVDERDFGIERFGLDPAECHVIEHGVDPDRFRPADPERRAGLRERFGLDPAAIVIGVIGRIGPQKDYPTLYRALAPVLAQRPDLQLLQVGRGPDEVAVASLASALGIDARVRRVEFLEDTSEFYHAVDLVVMASTYEAGIPYVALEAAACGLPMALTEAPGLRTIAGHPFDAIAMAAPGDPASIREAVLSALDRVGQPNNQRQVVLERFTQDRARQRVLETYSSTLGRHGKGTVTLLS
jgi:glycosyltransferase involved in cell wall biosynthesis